MATYRNDLEQFIYEYCFDEIFQAASAFLSMHPTVLDLSFSRIKYPESANVLSLLPEFATNITIDGDQLSFDAIMSGIIELTEETYNGGSLTAKQKPKACKASQGFIFLSSFQILLLRNIV